MTLFLAIESSCDDTSIAVVNEHYDVIWEKTFSHTQILQKYSGVVPESVSREHLKAIYPLITALKEDLDLKTLDAIAYTHGPGLAGSLLVGSTLAHSLSLLLNKPLLPIHHLKGHFYAYLLETKKEIGQALGLIVSGGHTQILQVSQQGSFKILGQTRDDAVGEVFDKVAKHTKLGYPGGPKVSQMAQKGQLTYTLTKPMLKNKTLEMSFSGLKSQTIRAWDQSPHSLEDLCYSFEQTITQTLVKKVALAIENYSGAYFILAGGVAANKTLRQKLTELLDKKNIQLIVPNPRWCTDNAAMIGACAIYLYHYHKDKNLHNLEKKSFIKSTWSIQE